MALGRQRTEQQRPDRGATVTGDEPDLDVGIDDHRVLGHHDDVAEERHRRTQPGGGAVQPAHDRHIDVEEVPDHLLGLTAQRVRSLDGAQRREPLHVAAGRERPAGAGQDDGARLSTRCAAP